MRKPEKVWKMDGTEEGKVPSSAMPASYSECHTMADSVKGEGLCSTVLFSAGSHWPGEDSCVSQSFSDAKVSKRRKGKVGICEVLAFWF